jgi:hypothetical protein
MKRCFADLSLADAIFHFNSCPSIRMSIRPPIRQSVPTSVSVIICRFVHSSTLCLSVILSFHNLSVYPYFFLASICLFFYHLFVCLSVLPSIRLSIFSFLCLSVILCHSCSSLNLFIYLSVCLSLYLSLCLFFCLSLCQFLSVLMSMCSIFTSKCLFVFLSVSLSFLFLRLLMPMSLLSICFYLSL